MKIETTEFYKVARNTAPKKVAYSKRDAWANKAFSGTAKRIKVQARDNEKMF
jgi:hypothetical protein